ncbi:MAG TPA: lipase family protein [Prolixibacteraceae bacterium]
MVRNFYFFAFLLFVSVLVSNCKSDLKTEEIPVEVPKDKYLVSYNVVRSMTASDINILYSPAQYLYPDMAAILPYVKNGAKVYSITYNTTLGTKKLVASGLVTIPDGGATYPILSFQNGTNTLYADAPSLNAYSYIPLLINGFATTGFVVLMPDYLGFGSSTEVFHPYLVLDATVNPILDMFRAVKEMSAKTDLAFKLSSDLYIMGYSQGGLATLQLQKSIETSYSGEFNLKAVGVRSRAL